MSIPTRPPNINISTTPDDAVNERYKAFSTRRKQESSSCSRATGVKRFGAPAVGGARTRRDDRFDDGEVEGGDGTLRATAGRGGKGELSPAPRLLETHQGSAIILCLSRRRAGSGGETYWFVFRAREDARRRLHTPATREKNTDTLTILDAAINDTVGYIHTYLYISRHVWLFLRRGLPVVSATGGSVTALSTPSPPKASDVALEALAERNLADAEEAEGDLRRALRHLRRCRALAQRGRNAALEADACRRLSSVYTEIAASASLEIESSAKETKHEHGDGTVEDVPESPIPETQVRVSGGSNNRKHGDAKGVKVTLYQVLD